eukprot:CAMPEP_0178926042 /NCGR_PEP_ID=MMETSP0786-20121207/18281_1 /TAXON_ID=186022 /ORGANISM="Thalassionema frauenfeldii, Strain CCMP 1798" /LENGTH=985 /DNA_ID=CAMNT_0020601057 /DNA_START=72 /DNA_END=3026 /DNA_ORIENTATION=-
MSSSRNKDDDDYFLKRMIRYKNDHEKMAWDRFNLQLSELSDDKLPSLDDSLSEILRWQPPHTFVELLIERCGQGEYDIGETLTCPLYIAVLWGASLEVLQTLLKYDPNEKALKLKHCSGRTCLQLATRNKASVDILKVLHHPSILSWKDEDHKTCLHYAAEKAMPKEAFKLLFTPEILSWRDTNARTCLHLALAKGEILDKDRLQYLLSDELREEILTARDQDGSTCLHYAASNGASLEVLKWLMPENKEILSWRNKNRNTCLHFAAQHADSLECLQLLMPSSQKEILRLTNKTGQTCLHYACSNTKATYEMLEFLLPKDKTDVKKEAVNDDPESSIDDNRKSKKNKKKSILTWTDKQELTCLHNACSNPNLCHSIDVLKLLLPLSNREDCDDILKGNGYRCQNCLFLAAEQGDLSLETLKLLLPQHHRRDVLFTNDYEGTRCLDLVFERSSGDLELIITHLWEAHLFNWRELSPYSQKLIANVAVTSSAVQNCIITDLSDRTTTFLIISGVYIQVAWMSIYGIVLEQFYRTQVDDGLVIILYILTGLMGLSHLLRVIYRRWGYIWSFTNLLQLTKIPFVIVSGIFLQTTTYDGNSSLDILLTITSVVMVLSCILFLGRTFGSVGIFVQGILSLSIRLVPFWILAALVLYVFSILYFIQASPCRDDASCTLSQSIMTAFFYVFNGTEQMTWLDALFALAVLLFLTSFLISIMVTNLDATLQSFYWLSCMAHLASVELLSYRILCGFCCGSDNNDKPIEICEEKEEEEKQNVFEYVSQSLAYYEKLSIRDSVDWRTVPGISSGREYYEHCQRQYSFERHYYWASKRTIHANLGCIRVDQKVEILETDDFPYTCFEVTLQAILYIILLLLGFVTAGLLWPRRVRRFLFEAVETDDESKGDKSSQLISNNLEEKVSCILEHMENNLSIHESSMHEMKEKLDTMEQRVTVLLKRQSKKNIMTSEETRIEQRIALMEKKLDTALTIILKA